jgi:tetratricopeptide (TPR) repeat protein
MEHSKLSAMMEGKTLTKENIDHMYQMVQSASTPEDKTNVMKHSVFFVGQLPLNDNNTVDILKTRQMVGAYVMESELDDSMDKLLSGLSTQKLLLKEENGSYKVNTKYEKSILKVRKIAKAWQMEKDQIPEDLMHRVKKMYQMGTRYYNAGDYEEAAASFMNTVEMAEYRMGYYSLALMYRDGKGVEPSLEQALFYARAAIARGARIAEALEEDILERMG